MQNHKLTLQVSNLDLTICRLPREAELPAWIEESEMVSFTRTEDELSIVCSEYCVPEDVIAERHWRMLKVKGPLDFSLTGVIATLTAPLSEAGIAVFVISTFETDYLLVKSKQFDDALDILRDSFIIEK
jgi:hypothetical protein